MGNICGQKEVQPIENEDKNGDAEEAVNEAEDEIIGELPALKKEATRDREIGTRNSRVTLMARPQCIAMAAEEDEKIVTIAYTSMNINVNSTKCQSLQSTLSNLSADSNRICLYAGPIDETLRNAKIDVAMTKNQTDASPERHVLSTSSASQFILERFGQKIGIIGLPDID